jgi:hypothetical protein
MRGAGAGVLVAVMGRLSPAEAERLAVCRTEGSQAIAVLLAVSTWTDSGRAAGGSLQPAGIDHETGTEQAPASPVPAAAVGPGAALMMAETAQAMETLRAAGWHVITVDSRTPLDRAWEQLPRAAEMLVPGAALGGHDLAGRTA